MELSEIKAAQDALNARWEEFKTANDARLKAIEKGEGVAECEAKLAKLNTAMDEQAATLKELSLKANRPVIDSGDAKAEAAELKSFNAIAKAAGKPEMDASAYRDYKNVLSVYVRKGLDGLSPDERKTINVGTDSQGGYLTSFDMEASIDRVVRRYSAMRQLARVIPIGNASYKKLVKTAGVSGGSRGGETTAPSNGTSPTWAELEFRPGTYISEQRITSESLEDSVQNVEADLIDEMGIEFAEMEGQDFIDGNGVAGPRGFQSYGIVLNSSYAWGSVGYVKTAGAASFAASNPSDALIDLQHALKRQYRANAAWTMNDATLGAIRKFKDGQGLYLWAPSQLMQGAVGQLLGHPVVTDDFMPDLGANAYPVAFGDFNRAYYIVDRTGVSILRDPYTAVPYVKFIARRRVGGGIANFEALKLLKCEA